MFLCVLLAGSDGATDTPPATAAGKPPVFQHAAVLDSYKGKPSTPGRKRKNSGSKLSPVVTATPSESENDAVQEAP